MSDAVAIRSAATEIVEAINNLAKTIDDRTERICGLLSLIEDSIETLDINSNAG